MDQLPVPILYLKNIFMMWHHISPIDICFFSLLRILLTHIFVYFQKSKLEGQVKRRSKSFELFQLNRLIVITRISLDFKNGYNGKAYESVNLSI